MGLCSWLVFGFLAGLVARAILPGEQRMGILRTSLLGIGGSFVGGLLASLLSGHWSWNFTPAGFIGSVVGALVLLILGGMRSNRRY